MVAERLDRALRSAAIPILGVSVGSEADRATWVIQFAPAATAQQRTDGETLRLSFDPLAQAAVDAETADRAATVAAQKDLLATIALMTSLTDANWGTKTLAQKVAAVRANATSWQTLRAFVEKNL
jgi:hypothetical protein